MEHFERELDVAGFFTPAHKKDVMVRNLRNILNRRDLTAQDVRTLHGVITQLVRGRRGSSDSP
jgi:tRNA/rRNA methyltransferase